MAEYINNEVQTIALNGAAVLYDSIPCNRGYVVHENGSGIVTLRGIVNNPCGRFARYKVTANCNIAIPTGGAVTPVAIALTVQGEPRLTSRAIFTPAAVEDYGNVTSTAIIDVPTGCCFTVSVRYVQATDDPAVTPTPFIEMQNLNLVVERIA